MNPLLVVANASRGVTFDVSRSTICSTSYDSREHWHALDFYHETRSVVAALSASIKATSLPYEGWNIHAVD